MSGDLIHPISAKHLVLATDLDGTFLGGSTADRARLYGWIEANRATVGLIFVTGRDPAFIEQMCHDGLPWPEFVIGDVGTTIAQVIDGKVRPNAVLETEIAAAWNGAETRVRAALANVPGLREQQTAFRYRLSYHYDPTVFDPTHSRVIHDMGLDVLMSDNQYFDVLPKGISKGPSLRLLTQHLAIPEHRVLAAGDTMNDYSMLALGLPAVAVGGAEPDLLLRVGDLEHVHKSDAVGAAGITDAIRALNLHPNI